MKIRPVQSEERKIWERLFKEYAEFYKTRVPDGGHDAVWDWIFDKANDFWCDVIVDDNDLLALHSINLCIVHWVDRWFVTSVIYTCSLKCVVNPREKR